MSTIFERPNVDPSPTALGNEVQLQGIVSLMLRILVDRSILTDIVLE